MSKGLFSFLASWFDPESEGHIFVRLDCFEVSPSFKQSIYLNLPIQKNDQTFRDPTGPARSESIHDGRLSRRFFMDSWQEER